MDERVALHRPHPLALVTVVFDAEVAPLALQARSMAISLLQESVTVIVLVAAPAFIRCFRRSYLPAIVRPRMTEHLRHAGGL